MAAIDTTTSTTTGAASAAAATKSSKSEGESAGAATLASDFETFLKLLTTQMRNQDPLKPLESTEFVAQLATFSSVEQQVATNTWLKGISDALTGGAAGLAGWLGAEVQAAMPFVWNGGEATAEVDPASGADKAVMVVRAADGLVVHRETLETDVTALTWDGTGGTEGEVYTIELERYAGEEQLGVEQGRIYATVREVRPGPTGAELRFDGGVSLQTDEVTALRSAEG